MNSIEKMLFSSLSPIIFKIFSDYRRFFIPIFRHARRKGESGEAGGEEKKWP
ncbi:MAG: hypothetical protein LBG65_03690 [Puniceicoccales bacterium]|jgi:hypothetical protein|nr:hypothetical protein [Puniceicoccales bacterium]